MAIDVDQQLDTLLRIRDVALVMGMHPSTVRRKIADGKLPAIQIDGSVRVRKSDLVEYLAKAPAKD